MMAVGPAFASLLLQANNRLRMTFVEREGNAPPECGIACGG
jgi:hypothetical protein